MPNLLQCSICVRGKVRARSTSAVQPCSLKGRYRPIPNKSTSTQAVGPGSNKYFEIFFRVRLESLTYSLSCSLLNNLLYSQYKAMPFRGHLGKHSVTIVTTIAGHKLSASAQNCVGLRWFWTELRTPFLLMRWLKCFNL